MKVVLFAVGYGAVTFWLWLCDRLHLHVYKDSHTNHYFELTGQTCRCGAVRWRHQLGYGRSAAIFGAWQYGPRPTEDDE